MSRKSIVVVNKDKDLVIKTPTKWADMVFNREIFWLKKFISDDRFPTLIGCDNDTLSISMNYCGEPLSISNCPSNIEDQVEDVLYSLLKYGCSHNDIKPQELMIKDGTLRLIDFGWATCTGESIPKSWPVNLGGDFRPIDGSFDDEYSLRESVKFAIKIL